MQWWLSGLVVCALGVVTACGKVEQSASSSGKTLCFDYFQRCVNPVFGDVQNNGAVPAATSNCSDSGCHQSGVGPGGALKLNPGLFPITLTTPAQDRTTQMYANFLSAKGSSNLGSPRQSFLIKKPLVEITHAGGLIFPNDTAKGIREFQFWISQSVDDEFGAQCALLTTCQP